jgi:hypothetical protein
MPSGKNKKRQNENEEDKCAERLTKRREKKRKNSIENASSISVGKEYTVGDFAENGNKVRASFTTSRLSTNANRETKTTA